MLKKVTWFNHNRVIFESEHKTYNKKINCPSVGNTIDGGYLGLFVRAYNKIECNGHTSEPGHLQQFDLQSFRRYSPPHDITSHLKDRDGILYCLRHYNGDQCTVHGWILTDTDSNLIRIYYANNSYKSQSVVDTFRPYVVND